MFYGPCFMFDVSSMSALGTDQPGCGPLSLSLPTTTTGQLGNPHCPPPTHPGPTQCSCPKPSAPFSPHLGAGGPYMVDLGGNGMTLGVSKSLQVFGLQEPVPSLQLAGSDLLSAAAAHHHGRRRTFLLTLATISASRTRTTDSSDHNFSLFLFFLHLPRSLS